MTVRQYQYLKRIAIENHATWRGGKISSFHALILLSFGGRDNLFFWDITAENLQVAKILNAVLVPAKIIFSKKNRFRVYRKLACRWITIAKGLIDSAIHSKMEISFAIVYYLCWNIVTEKSVNSVSKGTVCSRFFKALQSLHCASVLKLWYSSVF